MANPTLTINHTAQGPIAKRRIVAFGTSDRSAVQATGSSDSLMGVTTELDAAPGERTDVILAGVADVEYGGNVARGALLTSDAQGRAVEASSGRVIGIARVSGVLGDLGEVFIAPSLVNIPE